jgi:NADH-quinone oxidoreductase subunit H
LTALLFFGGWHFPGLSGPVDASLGGMLLRLLVLLIKVCGVVALIMLLRWALPRFRFDQLMGLAWKGLLPLGLANLVCVAVVLSLGFSKYWLALTAVFPVVAAYVSVLSFNASMAATRAQRTRRPIAAAQQVETV